MDIQVKSKKRVADYGEVFTNPREVNAMLDLVKQETERIESRFLEPACGTGNFLVEILRRKLAAAKRRYKRSPSDYERMSFIAVTSIYGVELLQDNVDECRERLFEIWDSEYKAICKKECNDECREAVRYVLAKNILCGNARSLLKVDKNGEDIHDEPLIFAEWSPLMNGMIKRRDFRLDELVREQSDSRQMTLDSDRHLEYSESENAFIPVPVHESDPTFYRKVQEND
ncbi:MAG: hypothetical protein K2G60_02190 [Oscillospiraceae bacterium]|nr:hypothetical protein [Oscillospiraceae bacterium]